MIGARRFAAFAGLTLVLLATHVPHRPPPDADAQKGSSQHRHPPAGSMADPAEPVTL